MNLYYFAFTAVFIYIKQKKKRQVPMQRITTSLKKTDLFNEKQLPLKHENMQPKADTLHIILQFASTYRVQQIGENQFVELCLN